MTGLAFSIRAPVFVCSQSIDGIDRRSELCTEEEVRMTPTDIAFRYGRVPGMAEMRAISTMSDVYGVRKVSFDEAAKTVRVEFDASRMNDENVAALLRRAGLDLTERLALA